MNQQARPLTLPLVAMIVAALATYLGLPQIHLLSRVAPDAVAGARLAHPVLRAGHDRLLADAAPGSQEAEELEQQRQSGRRALGLIAHAPNFACTAAPVFAGPAADGFVAAPRPPAVPGAEFTPALAASLDVVCTHSRAPPDAGPPQSECRFAKVFSAVAAPRGPPLL